MMVLFAKSVNLSVIDFLCNDKNDAIKLFKLIRQAS